MFEGQIQLSPHGQRRREQILKLARNRARDRRRQRVLIRANLFGMIVLLGLGLCLWMLSETEKANRPHAGTGQVAIQVPRPRPGVVIERIATDPAISSRLAVAPSAPRWKKIDDHELLQALADAGRPAGLIEFDGKTLLLPRHSAQR